MQFDGPVRPLSGPMLDAYNQPEADVGRRSGSGRSEPGTVVRERLFSGAPTALLRPWMGRQSGSFAGTRAARHSRTHKCEFRAVV